jgi:integrase
MSAELDGVHFVPISRPGKPRRWYVYAWRGGPAILKGVESPTKPKLGRAEMKALEEALADATRPRDTGLLSGLIRQWRGTGMPGTESPEWKRLAPSTKETWGYALNAIEVKWGETPLAVWNDARMVAKVIAWRDSRAATPRAADIGVQVLSELLAFGKLRTLVNRNVAADVPSLYEGADRAEIIWLDEDNERFAWTAMGLNRIEVVDALDLANVSGLRRGDLVGVNFDEVTDHAIVRTARKRSRGRRRRAVIPLIPESRRLIAELRTRPREPGVNTLLVNSLGRPWTPGSLSQAFIQVRDAAGIVHRGDPELGEEDRAKHLHDCRGTFVTKLCRTNLTNEEIARIVAWSVDNVERIRRTYVDDAAVVVALSERIRHAV